MRCACTAQEVGWFDREENASGALSSRLSADTSVIRGALGDQAMQGIPQMPHMLAPRDIFSVLNWLVRQLRSSQCHLEGSPACVHATLQAYPAAHR